MYFTTFLKKIWQVLYLWVDAKMAPNTNKGSRTNSHQPSWLTGLFCGLEDRMADLPLSVGLPVRPLKFQGLSCLYDP